LLLARSEVLRRLCWRRQAGQRDGWRRLLSPALLMLRRRRGRGRCLVLLLAHPRLRAGILGLRRRVRVPMGL
jgi:hypothetical protein